MSEDIREVLNDGSSAAPSLSDDAALPPPSDTVTACDRWTRRRGEQLVDAWADLGIDGTDEIDAPHIAADSIETLLSTSPTLAENPTDEHRARWWKQLIDTPELQALRAQTVLQPALAELAASEIAKQWREYVVEHPRDEQPQQQRGGDGDDSGGDDESPDATVARIRSVRAAINAAQQAADEAQAIAAGLGLGTQTSVDAQHLAGLARRLKRSGVLSRIMQLAGRFVARAAALQRQRVDLPGLEVTGVELSGDVARLLPIETAFVGGAVPEVELLALYRLATRHALSYRRERREPVGMGPIVVSIDESTSMNGEKIAAAKALALAMASIARAQKRPITFASFAGTAAISVVDGNDVEAVVRWCESMIGGGTSFAGPLRTLRDKHWPSGKIGAQSDHIVITDAEVADAAQHVDAYREWAHKQRVRTFVIGIKAQTAAIDALRVLADGGIWNLPSLDLDSVAVETVLSIGPTAARRVA